MNVAKVFGAWLQDIEDGRFNLHPFHRLAGRLPWNGWLIARPFRNPSDAALRAKIKALKDVEIDPAPEMDGDERYRVALHEVAHAFLVRRMQSFWPDCRFTGALIFPRPRYRRGMACHEAGPLDSLSKVRDYVAMCAAGRVAVEMVYGAGEERGTDQMDMEQAAEALGLAEISESHPEWFWARERARDVLRPMLAKVQRAAGILARRGAIDAKTLEGCFLQPVWMGLD